MMNRREFSTGAACAVAVAALGVPSWAVAQAKAPKEGSDYRTLEKRAASEGAPGKIEVVEFFWYSCPHCNAFEPKLDDWSKKLAADVTMRRVPVAFRDDFVPQQRLYYTLEAMNRLGDMHRKVFTAIHAEKQALNKEDLILVWAEKQGLDKAKFQELYNSFSVQTKARKAKQLQDAYQLEGVPALGIAGRFYTDGTMAGTMDRALQVADYLVGEVRKSPKTS